MLVLNKNQKFIFLIMDLTAGCGLWHLIIDHFGPGRGEGLFISKLWINCNPTIAKIVVCGLARTQFQDSKTMIHVQPWRQLCNGTGTRQDH